MKIATREKPMENMHKTIALNADVHTHTYTHTHTHTYGVTAQRTFHHHSENLPSSVNSPVSTSQQQPNI